MYKNIIINDLFKDLKNQITELNTELLLISAFCKLEVLKQIDKILDGRKIKKYLLIRFKLCDILSKSTDIELYEYCKANNWIMKIKFDLHAKIFIFDNKKAIIGSANLTKKGLGLVSKHNIEMSTFILLDEKDRSLVKRLFNNASVINDQIYAKMLKQLIELDNHHSDNVNWSNDILNTISCEEDNILLVEDLPQGDNPFNISEHDKITFGLELRQCNDIEFIRIKFKRSKCFIWLIKVLKSNENEMFYGRLTQVLHNSLINSPNPYRKDVKFYLSNLLNWIVKLNIDEVTVDKPKYSQRIRLIDYSSINCD